MPIVVCLVMMGGILAAAPAVAAGADQGRMVSPDQSVLALRDRPAVENRILNQRLESLLPELMQETGFDMWLVLAREYAEDPVYFSLVPQPTFAARRTTMLVFHRDGDAFEKLAINRYPLGEPYESAWSGGELDAQWQALGDLIAEKDPQRIGINISRDWPVADGLTRGLHQRLMEVLPEGYQDRVGSAESLVVRWMETRTAAEAELYPQVVGLARQVIAEAFSNRVITPGATTTDEVAWYIRERFASMDLPVWFQPYVNIQRQGEPCEKDQDFCGISGVIRRGDVLHTDVGICYLKLCTDTQEMGYVLRLGEHSVPQGLSDALAAGNRWQNHLTDSFNSGDSGNRILEEGLKLAQSGDVPVSIYTHPIGYFGHAPGPTIGMWDNQGETAVRGDWPLYPMTAYAIEGNNKFRVPEWDDQWVQIKLEQTALYDGERVIYVAGRQTDWHVVE